MPYGLMAAVSGTPAILADLEVGDNAATGAPEAGLVADGQPAGASIQRVWDANPTDGFDTGWVDVSLVLQPGGGTHGITLAVEDQGPSSLDLAFGAINSVQLVATAAAGDTHVAWRDVRVHFYRNGQPGETITVGQDQPLGVNAHPSDPATQVLQITPTGNDFTMAVIVGQLRMQSSDPAVPAANAMAAQVLVDVNDPITVVPSVSPAIAPLPNAVCPPSLVSGGSLLTPMTGEGLPSELLLDASDLDLSPTGGSYGATNTDPLTAYRDPYGDQYSAFGVVVAHVNADIYVGWDANEAVWTMSIITDGGLSWQGSGPGYTTNPTGIYWTTLNTESGTGWIVVTA